MHTTVLHYTSYIKQCYVVYRSLNKVPGHFAFAHLILNPSHQDPCWMFSYRCLRSNVTQVFLSITFLLQVCSLLLLWRRVGWWDFTAEVGCEQRFKDDVLYPDVSGSVGCSLPQLLCTYIYIYKYMQVVWILAGLSSLPQRSPEKTPDICMRKPERRLCLSYYPCCAASHCPCCNLQKWMAACRPQPSCSVSPL